MTYLIIVCLVVGTPGRDTMSRSGSYLSQDGHLGTYPYGPGGTLPMSGNSARRGDPNPYGTYGVSDGNSSPEAYIILDILS